MWAPLQVVDLIPDSQPDCATLIADQTRPATRDGEPPAKRQRVDADSEAFKKSLRRKISQVIKDETARLPDSYDKPKIAKQVLEDAIESHNVKVHWRQHNNRLLPHFEAEVARHCVERIRGAQQYATRPTAPTLVATTKTKTPQTKPRPPVNQQRPVVIKTRTISPPKLAPVLDAKRPLRPLPRRQLRVPSGQPGRVRHQTLDHRPYRSRSELNLISKGIQRLPRKPKGLPEDSIVCHVDFSRSEIAQLLAIAKSRINADLTLEELCASSQLLDMISDQVPGRLREDVQNFRNDVARGYRPFNRVLSLEPETKDSRKEHQLSLRTARASSILFARELEGNRGFGRMRNYANFQNTLKIDLEDELELIAEFTNCAGDVATISWVSDDGLICGTTAHSDSHNQQYNKPGNFLLCSVSRGALKAFSDHRVPRPLVEKGENATEAMRQSQDPWLYTSVVASNYDFERDLGYTASFDKTVKVWGIEEDKMQCLATWPHQGNVNFVAAAKDGSGRVASAADVPRDAIRVYQVDAGDIPGSPYESYSSSRNGSDSEAWAYYPATMQWGKALGVQHLLLVGYSPRGRAGDDSDIPEEKRNTGAIELYDTVHRREIPVSTARSANVFEVAWHPTMQRFIAATSPCGLSVEARVRTQIHLFERDRDAEDERYCVYQTFDCWAADINELTFMPNSLLQAYVTAACTDGKVYVWDTAQGDKPIHILQHGASLEIFDEEHREKLDTGVKFTAWGTTLDRFYTGGSDGAVNVWNVRSLTKPHVNTLLEAPAPIASGSFSPDMRKLAIGDATGRLWLLSTDERDAPEAHFMTLPGSNVRRRCPRPFLMHDDPPPPAKPADLGTDMDMDVEDANLGEPGVATYSTKAYFDPGVLVNTRNPVIGVVQGRNYASSDLFRREAHLDEDPAAPLLTDFERHQRASVMSTRGIRRRSLRRLKPVEKPSPELQTVHEENRLSDKEIELWQEEIEKLPEEDVAELNRLGAILRLEDI